MKGKLDYAKPKRREPWPFGCIAVATLLAVFLAGLIGLAAFVRYAQMKPWPNREISQPSTQITPAGQSQ